MLDMGPAVKWGLYPSETPLEKANFSFPRGYQLVFDGELSDLWKAQGLIPGPAKISSNNLPHTADRQKLIYVHNALKVKLMLMRKGLLTLSLFCLETPSYSVAQARLELMKIVLPYHPQVMSTDMNLQASFSFFFFFFCLQEKRKILFLLTPQLFVPFDSLCNQFRMLP